MRSVSVLFTVTSWNDYAYWFAELHHLIWLVKSVALSIFISVVWHKKNNKLCVPAVRYCRWKNRCVLCWESSCILMFPSDKPSWDKSGLEYYCLACLAYWQEFLLSILCFRGSFSTICYQVLFRCKVAVRYDLRSSHGAEKQFTCRKELVSNWTLVSCPQHRITSVRPEETMLRPLT